MVEPKTIVTQGIVIRASNYRDNDKIVSIFTNEFGLISAKVKGARKANTKLKFASLPFCFAQFELSTYSENAVVNNAVEIENFFNITLDYNKYVYGVAILELVEMVALSLDDYSLFYSVLVKALHTLCFTTLNPNLVFFRFALGVFKMSGYQFNVDFCFRCGQVLTNAWWNHKTGELVCADCISFGDFGLTENFVSTIRQMIKLDFDKLDSVGEYNEQECCAFVQKNCELHFNRALNSIKQLA